MYIPVHVYIHVQYVDWKLSLKIVGQTVASCPVDWDFVHEVVKHGPRTEQRQ